MADRTLSEMAVEVTANTDRADRELQEELPRRAAEAGEEAAGEFGRRFGDSDEIPRGVRKAMNKIVQEAEATFRERIAAADSRLAEGVIDEDDFRREARRAVQAFNEELADAERALEQRGLSGEARQLLVNEMRNTGEEAVDAYVEQVREDVDEMDAAMEEAGRSAGDRFGDEASGAAQEQLDKIQKFLRGGFAAGIVAAVAFAGQRVFQMIQRVGQRLREVLERAGQVEAIRRAFRTLSAERGLSATQLLRELRQAARGTARDFELMRRANDAMQSGLEASEEQFGEMVTIARRMGKAVGVDANEAFDRFVKGIVRGRRRILDDIGLIVDFGEAHRRFADQVGKSVEQLSEEEKIQARLNEVLRVGRDRMEDLGEEVITPGQRVQQLTTFMGNFQDATAEAIATTPKMIALLDRLGANAEDSAEQMGGLRDAIGGIVDVAAELAGDPLENLNTILGLMRGDPGAQMDVMGMMGERVGERRQARIMSEIRTAGDLEALDERRVRLQEELNELKASEAETDEEVERILERREDVQQRLQAIAERRIELQQGQQREDMPEMTMDEARQAASDLRERLSGVEVQGTDLADTLREDVGDALGQLVEQSRELEEARGLEIGPTAEPGDAETRDLQNLRRSIVEIIQTSDDAEEIVSRVDGALADQNMTTQDLTESTSTLAREILTELMEALPEWAEAALMIDENEEGAEESTRDLADEVKNLAQLAGGVLNLADAFGIFGDEASEALQKGVSASTQLVQGVDSLKDAISEGAGFASMLGPIGAVAGGAAGLVSAVGGLFGESDEEKKERQRIEQEAAELATSLERLRNSAEAASAVFREMSGETLTEIQDILEGLPDRETELLSSEPSRQVALQRQLRRAGISVEQLETFADSLGIEINDLSNFLRGAETNVVGMREEIEALQEAAKEVRMERLFSTFAGKLDLLQRRMELFDVSEPAEKLDRLRELFVQATDLPVNIEQQLTGADLSTAEGRQQFEESIQRLFEAVASGQMDVERLGELNVEQFLDMLGRLEGTADQLEEAEGGAEEGGAGGFTQARQISRAQANRLVALQTTMVTQDAQRNRMLAGILRGVGGEVPEGAIFPRGGELVPPEDGAPRSGSGELAVSFENLVDDLTVRVDVGDADDPRAQGRQAGSGFMEEVDRGMEELRRRWERKRGG